MVSNIKRNASIPADSQGNKDGDGLSRVSTRVFKLLSRTENSHSQVAFAIKTGTLEAGTNWGLSFSVLTVILHTVSAQILISLISKPTVELNRCVLFSTISVL